MTPKFAWLLTLVLTSCTQFEFDVSRPDAAQPVHVGSDEDTFLAAAPLQYRMRADEGHLVVWIHNPTTDDIQLLGDVSRVIDSDGIIHPLRGRTVAALSEIKMVLPPLSGADDGPPPPNFPQPPNSGDQPGFISIPDERDESESNVHSWEWSGETEIEIDLTFEQGKRQFSQQFSIRRVRK